MAPRKRQGRRPKGSGSIYENKDGSYTAALEIDKHLYRRRAPDRQAAEAKLEELHELKRHQINIGSSEQTLTIWLTTWFTQIVLVRDIKPRTIEFYQAMIEQYIIPALGTIRLCDLRADHIQAFVNALRADIREHTRYDGARTVHGAAGVLSEALELAEQRKYIMNNPMRGVVLPKYTPTTIEPPTEAQVVALLTAAKDTRLEALWYCYALLGVRRGEGGGLRWSSLDWQAGTLRIDTQVQLVDGRPALIEPKTRAGKRVLPVPDVLLTLLRQHWDTQQTERQRTGLNWKEHGLIFPSDVGTPLWPRNIERQFYALRTQATLPTTITLHHLRHTVSTLLDEAGASEALKAGILGHGTTTITQRYTHARIDAMRRVLEVVAERVLRKAA